MSITPRLTTLLALAAGAFTATVAPAAALQPGETVITARAGTDTVRTARLSYADLDLARGHDYARLTRRVAVAADSVCRSDATWQLMESFDQLRCRDDAIAAAMAQLPGGRPARD